MSGSEGDILVSEFSSEEGLYFECFIAIHVYSPALVINEMGQIFKIVKSLFKICVLS